MLRSGHAGADRELLRMSVTIYHNPACGTSRNTLALIRATGAEPEVIHYLGTPPSREELVALVQRMGIGPRDILREKGTPYAELGLGNPSLTDDQLIAAMMEHPILINRPIAARSRGSSPAWAFGRASSCAKRERPTRSSGSVRTAGPTHN